MNPYARYKRQEIQEQAEKASSQIAALENMQTWFAEAHRISDSESEGDDIFEEIMAEMDELDISIDSALKHLRRDLSDLQDAMTRLENGSYGREEY